MVITIAMPITTLACTVNGFSATVLKAITIVFSDSTKSVRIASLIFSYSKLAISILESLMACVDFECSALCSSLLCKNLCKIFSAAS